MKDGEMNDKEKEKVSTEVALSAIKYTILRQGIGGDIVFDFDKSISFEGDSGPYLQYATVRANSILKKAVGSVSVSKVAPENWQTTDLERLLERFPSVLERAGTEYAPHYITTYLTELAGEFNSFYATGKIIDEADASSPYRLALTESFLLVMTSGLNLLGISVPERM
jgi:arginyl-tRNA synthetase